VVGHAFDRNGGAIGLQVGDFLVWLRGGALAVAEAAKPVASVTVEAIVVVALLAFVDDAVTAIRYFAGGPNVAVWQHPAVVHLGIHATFSYVPVSLTAITRVADGICIGSIAPSATII